MIPQLDVKPLHVADHLGCQEVRDQLADTVYSNPKGKNIEFLG